MESNTYVEIHMDELVDATGDNISESTEFLAINMEQTDDEGGCARCRTPMTVEQLIIQGRLQDLMRTIDYSKLDGRSHNGFTIEM